MKERISYLFNGIYGGVFEILFLKILKLLIENNLIVMGKIKNWMK